MVSGTSVGYFDSVELGVGRSSWCGRNTYRSAHSRAEYRTGRYLHDSTYHMYRKYFANV